MAIAFCIAGGIKPDTPNAALNKPAFLMNSLLFSIVRTGMISREFMDNYFDLFSRVIANNFEWF